MAKVFGGTVDATRNDIHGTPAPLEGLSEAEARERLKRGEGNNTGMRPSRTYWDIARANLFTLFNNILFVIGVALIAVGRYNDALTSVGLGLINALISTFQEIRAKRQLDRITLVSTPKVTVVREGRAREVHPDEIVRGDVIQITAGDQTAVDGVVLDGTLEMDESLLTGEPDLIRKQIGDATLSRAVFASQARAICKPRKSVPKAMPTNWRRPHASTRSPIRRFRNRST